MVPRLPCLNMALSLSATFQVSLQRNAVMASQALRILAACIALLAISVKAEDVTHYDEPGFYPGRDYINQHFAEHIDPFTGSLSLHFVDLYIAGNGGFDLKIQRSYNRMRIAEAFVPFGRGWDIHFGRVRHAGGVVCSQAAGQSLTLELPDGSQQTLHKSNGVGGTAANVDYLTSSFWKGQCLPAGINIFSPDGTKYEMTEEDGTFWHVKKITDRNGNYFSFSYTASQMPAGGRKAISSILRADGSAVTFTYAGNKLTSISGAGRTWNYTVGTAPDGSFQLTRVSPPAGAPWIFDYNGNLGSTAGSYSLQRIVNPHGGSITYLYGFVNFLPGVLGWQPATVVTQKTVGSYTWSFAYSPSCPSGGYDQTTMTLPSGIGTVTYKHFGYCTVNAGDVWKVGLIYQKLLGSQHRETFSWVPHVISDESQIRPGYNKFDMQINRPLLGSHEVNRDGWNFITNHENFDSFGNALTVSETGTRIRSRTLTFANDTTRWLIGFPLNENIAHVGSITRSRDSDGNLRTESRFGVSTTFSYGPEGTISSKRNARGNTVNYSGYQHGVPTSETRPEGVSITRSVDNVGNVNSETDGVSTWGYSYDNLNRITSVDFPTGSDATITWTNTSRSLSRGAYSESTDFDGFGRPTTVTRAGIATTFSYDALGRKTFESLPGSTSGTTFVYDMVGRVTRATSPAGTKTYSYSAGNVTVTNERGFATTYEFDRSGDNPDEGFVAGINSPEGTAVSMIRDEIGTLLSASQGGIKRTYGRDSSLFLTSVKEPETGTTSYGRDAVGNMTSKSSGGITVNYSYDGLERLESANYGGSTGTVSFTYDGRGKITRVVSASAQRDFTYDANGNLTQDKLTVDGQVFAVDYAYNSIDGLVSITYPLGKGTVTYAPDSLGRPTQAMPHVSSVVHFPSGNLSSISFANGIIQSFAENSRQLPSGTTASAIQLGLTYNYDAGGNVTSITNAYNSSESRTLGYDGVDRLISASGPWGGSGQITYGTSGNINFRRLGTYEIFFTSSSNRVSGFYMDDAPFEPVMYDARGSITLNGRDSFQYDNASNLRFVNRDTSSEVEYAYDGKGYRVWQRKQGLKTYFVHSADGKLLFEYTPVGDLWKQHVYVHGQRVATTAATITPTTTSLTANPASLSVGSNLTLTASVSPSQASGTVQFRSAASTDSVALVNGSAAITRTMLTAGTFSYTAEYSGSAIHEPSASAPVTVVVSKRDSSVNLSAAPNPGPPGQRVELRAVVSGSNPTGSVRFLSGTTVLGTISLGGGFATFLTPALPEGVHLLSAEYLGDSAHNNSSASVSVTISPSSPPNTPPTVTLTSPVSNDRFVVGQTISVAADAADSDGIHSVTFLDGSIEIGTVLIAPYALGWSNSTVGEHVLTARAKDNRGTVTTSSAVNITVACAASNLPPTVSINSPANGSVLAGPLTLSLDVSVADPEGGSIIKVEYFRGNTKIGTATALPFSFEWQNVGGGTYALTAKAYDDCGLSTVSAPITITVSAPIGFVNGGFESPVIAQGSIVDPIPSSSGWSTYGLTEVNWLITSQYLAGGSPARPACPEGIQCTAYRNTDGVQQSVYLTPGKWQISFRAMVSPPTPLVSVRVLKDGVQIYEVTPTGGSWSQYRTTVFTVTVEGSYDFVFTGGSPDTWISDIFIDDIRASAVSCPAGNLPPQISITSPANGASFFSPANISLSANVTDPEGNAIPQVEYFWDNLLVGTTTTAPYMATWNSVGVGTYTLTAKAHDDCGNSTLSNSITISVNPFVGFVNGGFESPVIPQGSFGDPMPSSSGWGTYGLTGINWLFTSQYLTSSSPARPACPEGIQCAGYRNTDGIRQSIYLTPGKWQIFFRAMVTPVPATPVSIRVLKDGMQIYEVLPSGSWSQYRTTVVTIPSAGNFDFVFTGGSPNTWVANILIDDVRATAVSCPTGNLPPQISIASPANGASLLSPANISLSANVTDPEGGLITQVEYFWDNLLVGTATAVPYNATWNNVDTGTYTLRAKAHDDCGNATVSNPITISVNPVLGFVNGGFESPNSGGYVSPMPTSSGWGTYGLTSVNWLITSQYLAASSPPRPACPEGNQCGGYRNTDGVQQNIYLTPGNWQISFRAMVSPPTPLVSVRVLKDGVQIYEVTPTGGSWSPHLSPVIPITTAGYYVFVFTGGSPTTWVNNLFIDNIRAIGP